MLRKVVRKYERRGWEEVLNRGRKIFRKEEGGVFERDKIYGREWSDTSVEGVWTGLWRSEESVERGYYRDGRGCT